MNVRLALILSLLFVASCGDNDPVRPGVRQTSGTSTLASIFTGDGVLVFSFEEGGVVVADSSRAGDLLSAPLVNAEGQVIGAFLGAPQDSSFALVASYETYDEAQGAFNALEDPGALDFDFLAFAVPNQIWLVRTHDGRWAKILIIAANGVESENEQGESIAFGVVTFHWVYRLDGSRVFDAT
jgi:hypothetical protein